MKTTSYNPSKWELDFAKALLQLQDEIDTKMAPNKIVKIEKHLDRDNPTLIFYLEDEDSDQHELVVKLIQRVDK